MRQTDNPAGRLFVILERAQRVPVQTESALAGWCKIWGVEPDAHGRNHVMRKAAEMIEMAQEIRTSVESLEDDDPETILMHFGEVEAVLNNFTGVANITMQQFLQSYGTAAAHSLRLCSSLLRRRMPEPILQQTDIDGLSERVKELAQEVDQADDLDNDLRRFISERLWAIVEALCNYDVGGFRGVEDATEQLIGTMAVRSDVWRRVPRRWVGAVGAVGGLITWTLGNAAAAKTLTEDCEPQQQMIVNIYNQSINIVDQPQLERGQGSADEVIEGELVENGPPGHDR